MNLKTIRISIIIPVYNAEKYLRQCIDSVLSQDLTDLEVIAVDDGSTDSPEKFSTDMPKKIPASK